MTAVQRAYQSGVHAAHATAVHGSARWLLQDQVHASAAGQTHVTADPAHGSGDQRHVAHVTAAPGHGSGD